VEVFGGGERPAGYVLIASERYQSQDAVFNAPAAHCIMLVVS